MGNNQSVTPSQQQKLDQARLVVEDALITFAIDKSIIAWSAGKDSTLVLKLVIDWCREHAISPPKVLDIDQGDSFEEMLTFRAYIAREWALDLIVVRNDDFLDKVSHIGDVVDIAELSSENQNALDAIGYHKHTLEWKPADPTCNFLMKTVPVLDYLTRNNIGAMFTGIRWDEHPARESETFFSLRENPSHTRVHPILHFTERDVWDITFYLGMPYSPLYAAGYRSIDTRSATNRLSQVPAWEQDLEHSSERGGRSVEKEKMMEQLRALGYM
jgi:phosphoadenosine phosphosulfate reductase